MRKLNKILLPVLLLGLQFYVKAQAAPETWSIDFAYDADLFSDINKNDAMAALDVWSQTFVKKLDLSDADRPAVRLHFIEDMPGVLSRGESAGYDVLNVLTIDYLQYADRSYWQSIAVSAPAGHFPEAYLLLVRKDSGLQNEADLCAKTLSLFGGPDTCFSKVWLQTLLGEAPGQFLKQIVEKEKPAGVILDVFFKKADACVVSENVYETMCALNMQLKIQLRILRRSPGISKGIICLRRDFNRKYRQSLLNGLLQLGNSESGSQILKLFGQALLLPFEQQQLAGIDSLLQQYRSSHKEVR